MENSNNNVWVVYIDEAFDGDQSSYILGVYKNRGDAEKVLADHAENIKRDCAYDTIEQNTLYFKTFDRDGFYAQNHYCIYAVEQEVK